MKRSLLAVTALMVSAMLFSACAWVKTPAVGLLYSDVKGPLAVTGNVGYSKVGISVCSSIPAWVVTGDASIKAAMENGGISKIHHVDYKCENILGIYAKLTVIVYGE